ncbi:MAG TPA: DUF1553 domain-containing protein, partial [Pirellulaceae bacterium]|nr:DUF1553 domain-containing protein [Pirellulaceae bacterium]
PATPLAVEPLELVRVESTGNNVEFETQADSSLLVVEKAGEPSQDKADGAGGGEDYLVITRPKSPGITGLRIDALRDDKLPKQGPGRANSGNFVLTGLSVDVVDSSGQVIREVKLQRVTADHEQTSFKAADVLNGKNAPKQGWAVGGKIGASHNLTVRTFESLTLADGESLRVTLRQNYGSKHALGRFKVSALTGDARGLQLPANIITALEMYPEKRIASTKQSLFDFFAAQDAPLRELEARQTALDREYQVEFRGVRTLGTSVRGRKTHRFNRGEFLQPVEEVTPGFIGSGFLSTAPSGSARLTRLDLARWLVGESNPLTPRVAANHVWDRLFGGGIVRTPSDFGLRGERPSNPELLDWLAVVYRDDLRWSTKRLIKTIVMSATYRQSSAVRPELLERDPSNELLARQNRPRVEGEVVRDLALDAAGLLSPKVGGPSVFPPMPADLAKLSYANSFSWTDSKGEDRYRRGMYTFFKRTIPHPTLMTFDCPDANVACVHRSVSNTPLQALTLLNNESFVEAAQALAKRVLAGGQANDGGDSARLERAIRLCLVRRPSTDEVERFAGLLAAARTYYAGHEDAAKQIVGQHAAPGVP